MHAPQPLNVVLAHGCFDVLHLGHIRHLQEAKALGDKLVVSVTADAHVRKGAGRPVFTAAQRVEQLKAIACVDDAFVNDAPDAVTAIDRVKPAVYVKGLDYAARADAALEREIAAVTAHGGRFHVTRTDKWSSTRIINGERLGDDVLAYLDKARDRGWLDQIHAAFERADQLSIAFVGETIVDEYRYVTPLGRPLKEFCLATVEAKEPEAFLGGVVAASLHAEWPKTEVITNNHVTITKTRFVDSTFNRKLFEVYSKREIELVDQQREQFRSALFGAIKSSDVVVVLDFGHGLMDDIARKIVEGAKFLALNAQTNTGNYGFNPVTRYPRADYVCVDEPEARLATVMQTDPTCDVVTRLAARMRARNVIVTNGRNGCLSFNPGEEPVCTPAFASNGIDTMGAGDAFLAATAPLIAAGLDLEAAALVGNVAGAIKVGIVGHQRHVGRDELLQSVEALLK